MIKLLDSELPHELVDVIDCSNAEANNTSYDKVVKAFKQCVEKAAKDTPGGRVFVSTGGDHNSPPGWSGRHDSFSSGLR